MTQITTLHSLNEKIITGIRKLLMKRWKLYYTINRRRKVEESERILIIKHNLSA